MSAEMLIKPSFNVIRAKHVFHFLCNIVSAECNLVELGRIIQIQQTLVDDPSQTAV
jgi:hypothetical protein